jgi:Holliday junction resolvase
MISERTRNECIEHIRRWQKKHNIREEQIEELLRWMAKANGNQSFRVSMIYLLEAYIKSCDER